MTMFGRRKNDLSQDLPQTHLQHQTLVKSSEAA